MINASPKAYFNRLKVKHSISSKCIILSWWWWGDYQQAGRW